MLNADDDDISMFSGIVNNTMNDTISSTVVSGKYFYNNNSKILCNARIF